MIPVDSFHAFHVSIVSSESVKGRESEGKEMDGGKGGGEGGRKIKRREKRKREKRRKKFRRAVDRSSACGYLLTWMTVEI